jgi:hypothetical protein
MCFFITRASWSVLRWRLVPELIATQAKLPSGVLVDVVAFHYARALRGEDYDAASSWGQRDMEELRQALHRGRINMISPRGGGTLLVLEPGDLYPLQLLFERISRGGNW